MRKHWKAYQFTDQNLWVKSGPLALEVFGNDIIFELNQPIYLKNETDR